MPSCKSIDDKYSINDEGNVFVGVVKLKPFVAPSGSLVIRLNHGKKVVARLLLEAFVCERPENKCAVPKDGNKLNSRLDNWSWEYTPSVQAKIKRRELNEKKRRLKVQKPPKVEIKKVKPPKVEKVKRIKPRRPDRIKVERIPESYAATPLDRLLYPEFYALVQPKKTVKTRNCLRCRKPFAPTKVGRTNYRICSPCHDTQHNVGVIASVGPVGLG